MIFLIIQHYFNLGLGLLSYLWTVWSLMSYEFQGTGADVLCQLLTGNGQVLPLILIIMTISIDITPSNRRSHAMVATSNTLLNFINYHHMICIFCVE